MSIATVGLKKRLEKLKAKREAYEQRHQEKCKPMDDEITQLLQMIAIAEPTEPCQPTIKAESLDEPIKYELRQPDQIGE